MNNSRSLFDDLPTADIEAIRANAELQGFDKGEQIFAQGDEGDAFFVIDEGQVTVHCDDDGKCKLLCELGAGEYFGEMGIINHDKRSATASASEASRLLRISREKFLELTESHPALVEKMSHILAQRNEELILRESLADATGLRSTKLYVSIKGDPSLRETALFRERYESPVDRVIDDLVPALEEILVNRCVYQLTLNFNSGELRVRTVFDPFRDKVHTVDRIIDPAYIERHFLEMPYGEKLDLISETCKILSQQPQFQRIPEQWKSIFKKSREQWAPLSATEVSGIISRLGDLRNIPEFYLRNFSVGILQDAIRLQFNCDGTHIVSAEDYKNFLQQNFDL